MRTKIKGIRHIPSLMKVQRKLQNQPENEYKMLNGLAQLSREKLQLNKEKENWLERLTLIDERLKEIRTLEELLKQRLYGLMPLRPSHDARQNIGQNAGGEKREMVIKY